MDTLVETSMSIKTTQPALSSPNGTKIALITSTHLEIRSSNSLDLLRTIPVTPNNSSRFLRLEWSPFLPTSLNPSDSTSTADSTRILFATIDRILIYDLTDSAWSATITNGSSSLGPITHAEFGANDAEILAFSSFAAKLTIWCLRTGKRISEIPNPKFATPVGYGRNKESRVGTFAVLRREGAQDVVGLYAPAAGYALIKTLELPTVDAQGMKWSRGGKWLAVWDTPSLGYKVHIYTAGGQLYRTYSGDYYDDGMVGLGLRTIEWSPNGEFCAIGGWDDSVTLLRTTTFTPAVNLRHTATPKLSPTTPAYTEVAQTPTHRTYKPLGLSFTLPKASASAPTSTTTTTTTASSSTSQTATPFNQSLQKGISHLLFSPSLPTSTSTSPTTPKSNFLATVSSTTPSTLWIWNLRSSSSSPSLAALINQHSVIRKLMWHPTRPGLLMIRCAQDERIVYFWDGEGEEDSAPRAVVVPDDERVMAGGGRFEAKWIVREDERESVVMAGTARGFVLVYPEGKASEEVQRSEEGQEQEEYKVASGGDIDVQMDETEHDHDEKGFSSLINDTTGKRDAEAESSGVFDESQNGSGVGMRDTVSPKTGVLNDTFQHLWKGVRAI